jgi:tetratricopeptide (TPR) repeat protein
MTARQPCFQRFQSPDPAALANGVRRDHQRLEQARLAQDEQAQLELLTSIGGETIILGREDEALPFIEEALALARKRGDKEYEVGNLLNLATAQQYLDQRDLAQTLFQQALDLSRAYGTHDYDDFIWHHRGRCYVEQGKIEEARACFEHALALREAKGEQRFIDSTRTALAALDQPLDTILGTSISFSLETPEDAAND